MLTLERNVFPFCHIIALYKSMHIQIDNFRSRYIYKRFLHTSIGSVSQRTLARDKPSISSANLAHHSVSEVGDLTKILKIFLKCEYKLSVSKLRKASHLLSRSRETLISLHELIEPAECSTAVPAYWKQFALI